MQFTVVLDRDSVTVAKGVEEDQTERLPGDDNHHVFPDDGL